MVFLTIFCVVFVYIAAVEYLTPADEYITAAKNSLDARIQDSSTSISIVVKFEEMSDESDKRI